MEELITTLTVADIEGSDSLINPARLKKIQSLKDKIETGELAILHKNNPGFNKSCEKIAKKIFIKIN